MLFSVSYPLVNQSVFFAVPMTAGDYFLIIHLCYFFHAVSVNLMLFQKLFGNFSKQISIPHSYHTFNKNQSPVRLHWACGAEYEARTRYLHLGKVALYQMS